MNVKKTKASERTDTDTDKRREREREIEIGRERGIRKCHLQIDCSDFLAGTALIDLFSLFLYFENMCCLRQRRDSIFNKTIVSIALLSKNTSRKQIDRMHSFFSRINDSPKRLYKWCNIEKAD